MSKQITPYKPTYYRFHWNWFKSKLFVHETKKTKVVWGLRIVTAIGVLCSFFIPVPLVGGTVDIILIGIQVFLENSVIEYTSIIAQPPPQFKLELDQWVNNAIGIPQQSGVPIAFGPAYKSEDYVYKIWRYIGSWNNDVRKDSENNIVVSIVIEDDQTYSTYIYSSPHKKSLAEHFELLAKEKGNSTLAQMRLYIGSIFWRNTSLVNGGKIDTFTQQYIAGQEFLFAPSVINETTGDANILHHLGFLKYHLKIRKRNELTESDPEYYLTVEEAKLLE